MIHSIELKEDETDIELKLPSGDCVIIQFRTENSYSIDVCLPTECEVYNWKGDDMQPAREVALCPYIRFAKQLMICLPESNDNE